MVTTTNEVSSSTPSVKHKPRRALFIAYGFPPVGGVSVHRATKFVKYLPEFGWEVSVLTVANPSVPLFDESLLGEIPPETRIRRARTLEPGYAFKSTISKRDETQDAGFAARVVQKARDAARRAFTLFMQPDPQILWRPHALREGVKLLREVPHDVVVVTGPPFSSFLLGMTLAKRMNLPLAVDFRDEWSIMCYWENKKVGVVDRIVQGRMQANVLRAADLVISTTPATADELRALVNASGGKARVDHIYNGFDPSDYPVAASGEERIDYGSGPSLFRMVFVGTLWNVTPITPLVDGIVELAKRSPHLASKLELVIAGRRTDQQEVQLDRLASTQVKLVRLPFVAHKTAIQLMCQADAQLLINADMPDTDRLINAKAFEYMAARRPIFVIAPEGEMWRLLADMPGTLSARPGDVESISANLQTAIMRWQDGTVDYQSRWNLAEFERRNLTGRLAAHLDELVSNRAVRGG